MSIREKLTADDWVAAASRIVARDGLERLAVEPLAAEMGTTKGSFYWHFSNRAALIDAVLELWEREATRQVMSVLEARPEQDRLPALVRVMFTQPVWEPLEWRILSTVDHPQVGPVVGRVEEARIAYVVGLLQDRGLTVARAEARARLLYAAYLGHLRMATQGERGLSEGARAAFVAEVGVLVCSDSRWPGTTP